MARWADDLDEHEEQAMAAVLDRLVQLKPRNWSVVRGDREIVVRPEDRDLGKFSVTIYGSAPRLRGAFFSRSLGRWAASEHFSPDHEGAKAFLDWAEGVVASQGF